MNVISLQFLGLAGLISVLIWIFPAKARPVLVAIGCAAFFAMLSDAIHWAYALALIVYTWIAGRLVSQKTKPWQFACLIAAPVLGLSYFKFGGFLGKSLIIPLGLSFYTFKSISYLCDIRGEKLSSAGFLYVFDYLSFFPTFEAGPINRAGAFFAELSGPFQFNYHDQKCGAFQCACGVFEKMVLADNLFYACNQFLLAGRTDWYMAFGMILYSFYIYSDFDAYSNIAIGLSRMMGFHIPANFHTPYLASSLRDFWRRWHISLSSWLKDYVYIPLGGSRKGYLRKCLNVMAVFLISGLWHGNTFMFILWGLGHGLVMVIEDAIRKALPHLRLQKAFALPAVLLNFAIVTLLWGLFRSPDIAAAKNILLSVLHPAGISYRAVGMTFNEYLFMLISIGLIVVTDLLRNRMDMTEAVSRCPFIVRWMLYAAMIALLLIFANYGTAYNPSDFVYVTF